MNEEFYKELKLQTPYQAIDAIQKGFGVACGTELHARLVAILANRDKDIYEAGKEASKEKS
jgi:hypothetical protein